MLPKVRKQEVGTLEKDTFGQGDEFGCKKMDLNFQGGEGSRN